MGKLKWKWLRPSDSRYTTSIYDSDSRGVQALFSFLITLVLFIPIGAPLDLLTPLPTVVWVAITLSPFFIGTFGWKHVPKLHWLYGMSRQQSKALEWYDTLTKEEKAQLPVGWDTLIRESGHQAPKGYSHFEVAEGLQASAEEVIRLYRESKKVPEIPDYRIETYQQLMLERRNELKQEINDRAEIEDKIKEMT